MSYFKLTKYSRELPPQTKIIKYTTEESFINTFGKVQLELAKTNLGGNKLEEISQDDYESNKSKVEIYKIDKDYKYKLKEIIDYGAI